MLKLWVKADRDMMPARKPAAALPVAATLLFALAGCAPPGWPEVPPSTAPGATAPAQGAKATSVFGRKEVDYLTFGAPKQIGDRPVMTPEQTAKMQADLENTAKTRDAQIKKNTDDAAQDGQAGQ